MKYTLEFGTHKLTYTISKSNRVKTSQITVDKLGVYVRSPISKTNSEIKRMVSGKKYWILRKQAEFAGEKKKIKIFRRSSDYLETRTWKLATRTGLLPTAINTKSLKSRWGSCTKTGIVNLNTSLSKAPASIIDYVIIHELCHLKIRNHSQQYWILVAKFIPDYKQKLLWLKANAASIL